MCSVSEVSIRTFEKRGARMGLVKGSKILVTGGAGFVGHHLVPELEKLGPSSITVPKRKECDLRRREQVDELFERERPDIVIHLAGRVGGISETKARPAEFFYDNLSMSLNVIDAAYRHGSKKFVGMGSVCSYPKFAPIPFKEEDLWNGYPEETNAPYGQAKQMMLVQTLAYRQQYKFNGIHLLTVNLYGPNDNFDPNSSHVIAGMITKIDKAMKNGIREVVFWGDGSPTREFLFIEDCARGISLATERYDKPEPINLGSGNEISIKDLAEKISQFMCYDGKIIWDESKPNGQPRRCLDVSKAKREFGFEAKVSFDDGLKKTIEWYLSNKTR